MKIVAILFFVFLEFSVCAQLEIGFSQYLFNPYVLNPALSGKEKCQTFSMGSRRQWLNLETTESYTTFSINANLSKGGRDNFKSGWHGIGGQVLHEVSGFFKVTRIMGSYAYHLKLNRKFVASFGTFVSFKRMLLMKSKLHLKDPNDPIIQQSGQVLIFPEISPGIWISSKEYFAGLSVWNIAHSKAKMLGDQIGQEATTVPHYYLTGGKKFELNEYIKLTPSFHLRVAQLKEPSLDINTLFQIGDYFKAGVGYRWQDAITSTIQVLIARKLSLGYGFDYTTSQLRYNGGNSHEFFISYTPCIKEELHDFRFWCPAY